MLITLNLSTLKNTYPQKNHNIDLLWFLIYFMYYLLASKIGRQASVGT